MRVARPQIVREAGPGAENAVGSGQGTPEIIASDGRWTPGSAGFVFKMKVPEIFFGLRDRVQRPQPVTSARQVSRMSMASSICSRVVISGGVNVSVLPMVVLNDRPRDSAR